VQAPASAAEEDDESGQVTHSQAARSPVRNRAEAGATFPQTNAPATVPPPAEAARPVNPPAMPDVATTSHPAPDRLEESGDASQFKLKAKQEQEALGVDDGQAAPFAVAHFFVTVPMFIPERFSFGSRENGYLVVLLAVVAIVVHGGVFPRLAKRRAERSLFSFGTRAIAFALLFLPLFGPGDLLAIKEQG
jgi:hypothetical protein